MLDRDETLAELATMVDYVNTIAEQSDVLEFEMAAELDDALGRVIAAARTAQSLINTQMLVRLEKSGSRVFGDTKFKRVRTYKERTNHDAVIDAIVEQAGYVDGVMRAAKFVAEKMRDTYVTPSTTAKKGAVDKLSLARDAVFSKDYTGWKVEREEVPDAPGE